MDARHRIGVAATAAACLIGAVVATQACSADRPDTPGEVTADRTHWRSLHLVDLIGLPVDRARQLLGTPGVHNTLAPADRDGLTVVADLAGAVPDDGALVVVGYCITAERPDGHRLTLGARPAQFLDPELRARLHDDPRTVGDTYQRANRCAASIDGRAPVTSIRVAPR